MMDTEFFTLVGIKVIISPLNRIRFKKIKAFVSTMYDEKNIKTLLAKSLRASSPNPIKTEIKLVTQTNINTLRGLCDSESEK